MIDTIIFDNEGVVVDTEAIWDRGQTEFLRRRGFAYDREKTKPLLTGASLEEGACALMHQYGFGGNPAELARERMEIVFELFEKEIKFIDGFRDFFEQIRGRFKTCIATAMSPELLEIADKKLGLSALFQGRIFSAADVGFRTKPRPDLFLYAADRLESKSENCVVIEDAPFGIEAARRAGMSSIGLTTTYPHRQLRKADLIVGSFQEIDITRLDTLSKPHLPAAHSAPA
jgi:beta-phosphoglucomutase